VEAWVREANRNLTDEQRRTVEGSLIRHPHRDLDMWVPVGEVRVGLLTMLYSRANASRGHINVGTPKEWDGPESGLFRPLKHSHSNEAPVHLAAEPPTPLDR